MFDPIARHQFRVGGLRLIGAIALAILVAAVAQRVGLPPFSPAHAASRTHQLPENQRTAYDFAVRSFREGRLASAYGNFVHLADGGHVASAESALFMLRNGEELFGTAWSASEGQQMRWRALAINGARDKIQLVANPTDD